MRRKKIIQRSLARAEEVPEGESDIEVHEERGRKESSGDKGSRENVA